jgi:hypothetical protein
MSGLVSVLSVSAGTLLAIALFVILVFWYIKDITQKKHTVLRNYPIIGRLRYFFEQMGEYFRQYFLHRRPRRDALQPRHARLGLSPGQERGRHHRLRLDLQPARAGRAGLRECAVSR